MKHIKNYVSRLLGVFWGGELEFSIIFVISLAVLEISVNYCKRKPKKVFFPGEPDKDWKKSGKQVYRGISVWGTRIFDHFCNIFSGS